MQVVCVFSILPIMPVSPFKNLKKQDGLDLTVDSEMGEGNGGRKSALKNSGESVPLAKHARVEAYNYASTPVTSVAQNLAGQFDAQADGSDAGRSGAVVSQTGSSGGAGDFSGGAAEKKEDEEPSLRDLMLQMSKMNTKLDDNFSKIDIRLDGMREDLSKFRNDLQVLKEDVVTKEIFATLEQRETKLETVGCASAEVSWLKDHVNRLDPASKCLCFDGFEEKNPELRTSFLEKMLKDYFASPAVVSIEHIWQGAPGARAVGKKSIVEFSSKHVREAMLKKFEAITTELKDASGSILKVSRAKSALQLKRNASLRKVADVLKKDDKAKNENVSVEWLVEGSKFREIEVDFVVAFREKPGEMCGSFVAPFSHLVLPN